MEITFRNFHVSFSVMYLLSLVDYINNLLIIDLKLESLIPQQPAINVLKEIKIYLHANPLEMITIIIEDHVASPNGVSMVFDAVGLRKFWFPASQKPKKGRDWQTVDSGPTLTCFHFKLF